MIATGNVDQVVYGKRLLASCFNIVIWILLLKLDEF